MNIFLRFPGIVLNSISFPLDQVAQFPVNHLTVQDLFHNPFFFSIYNFRKWGKEWVSPMYRVFRCKGQLNDIKDQV